MSARTFLSYAAVESLLLGLGLVWTRYFLGVCKRFVLARSVLAASTTWGLVKYGIFDFLTGLSPVLGLRYRFLSLFCF